MKLKSENERYKLILEHGYVTWGAGHTRRQKFSVSLAEFQTQYTGVVCSKMLELIYISRRRQLHEVLEIVSSFAVSFTKGEILESDDQRKTGRHHEILATV